MTTVGADIRVRPEDTRRVAFQGWGPHSPYSIYVQGALLHGRDDSALTTEG